MGKRKKVFSSIILGVFIGFINGFFGGGGGMVVVPALTKFFNLDQKKAHATSIAIILPITVISAGIYLFSSKMQWGNISAVSIGVTAGGLIGALALKKVNNKFLEYLFEGVMLFAGVKILFFN